MQLKQHNKRYIFRLSIVLICILLSVIPLKKLKVDYDFEAMFPNESGELDQYYSFRNQFGYDNEFVFAILENKKGSSVFDSVFLRRVDTLGQAIKGIEGITRAFIVSRISEPDLSSALPSQRPLLHLDQANLLKQDSAYLFSGHPVIGQLIAKNGRSIALYFEHQQGISKKKSDELVYKIRAKCAQLNCGDARLVGRIFAQQTYIDLISSEFLLFSLLSICVVVAILFFTFKTWRGILFPIVIVGLANYFTLAVMGLVGEKIGILSAIMPIMIFIAGMSDVVHFYETYLEHRKTIQDQALLFKKIFREVVWPTFYTLATTVVGFLSLLFSTMPPVRAFGIYTSVGIIFAFLLTCILLPSLLILFPEQIHKQRNSHEHEDPRLLRLLYFVQKNGKPIAWVTSLISIFIISSVFRLKEDHLIIDDLKSDVPLKQDVAFINQNYSGIRPLEVDINCNDVWNQDQLKALDVLGDITRQSFEVESVFSLAESIRLSHKILFDGKLVARGNWPIDNDEFRKCKIFLKQNFEQFNLSKVVDTLHQRWRLSSKIPDSEFSIIKSQKAKFYSAIANDKAFKAMSIKLTGAAEMIDNNNGYLVKNMLQGFAFSIVLIALLTWWIHRSWRWVLVFLVPNVLPLLLIAGIMGWLGIELKATTSMIFSIAFGIATDDTIHFISRIKIELQYGKTLQEALRITYLQTGRAVVITSIIITAGFSCLLFSDFKSNFYFGLLIMITMLIAVVCDLLLLPILIKRVIRTP